MDKANPIPAFRFSTTGLPKHERFDAWCIQHKGVLDIEPPADRGISFDVEMHIAQVGSVAIGRRTWLNKERRMAHRVCRCEQRLRNDDLDYYVLQLQRTEITEGLAGKRSVNAGAGALLLLDRARTTDLVVTLGETICMVVPRTLLDRDLTTLHCEVLHGELSSLVADYMSSLYERLPRLTSADVPCVAHVTTQLLRACLQPDADTLAEADSELATVRRRRVQRFINANLYDPDLGVGKICQMVGISRSTLYRMFESGSGVAHFIQRKRLSKAREALVNVATPRRRISEIAQHHGFTSDKNFSRVFKDAFGYTPREAREYSYQVRQQSVCRDEGLKLDATFSGWMQDFLENSGSI